MNLKQIKESARSLASQFRGNITMADAVRIMPTIQPSYAEYWENVANSIEAGNPLSASLPQVWPEALVSAVVAGEEAGKLEPVFSRITKAVDIQLSLRKQIFKLIYPGVIGTAGILAFIVIMVKVAPNIARTFRATESNAVTSLAMVMESFVLNYWLVILSGIGALLFFLTRWLSTEEGRATVLDIALSVPFLGHGLKDIYFGLWAEYMAMMTEAGIPTNRGVLLTLKVVPESLQGGFVAFERDLSINNLSVQDAASINLLREDDPRQEWPLFVRRALILGAQAGRLDSELQYAGEELVEQGVIKVTAALWTANVVATVFAAFLVAMSFVAVYAPILGSVKTFR